ncbi:MAG: Flagellin N-methylase [Euryarchaeota archaeon ADurb.BinA087]|nr:MAG: Flagellin N-methylase [Euryarchaeota archaeon ADurb.BinA087]
MIGCHDQNADYLPFDGITCKHMDQLPVPFRTIMASRQADLAALHAYPIEKLAEIISEVGFHCTCCSRCCTRDFNGHVLLLDADVMRIRSFAPGSLEPVPVLDFCDQNGMYYASGYTLRSQGDPKGSCHFLDEGRCRIYEKRPSICQLYPYLLHREPDDKGTIDWRQISGLNLHGEYNMEISEKEAYSLALKIKVFEEDVLSHEIAYLAYTGRYFLDNGLRNVRKRFDDGLRSAWDGGVIEVMVFLNSGYDRWMIREGIPIQKQKTASDRIS